MNDSRPQMFGMLAGLFLAAGLVVSAILGTSAWLKIRNSQFVNVKGSVQKNVTSDLVVWSGSFQCEGRTLLDAQRLLAANRVIVEKFLTETGVTNGSFSPIAIEEIKASQKTVDGFVTQKTIGYRMSQSVSVESPDVERLDHMDTTLLVEQGVIFAVAPPQFIYTKAGETKIELLAEATQDARTRAEQIARQGGRSIASLQSADQGVFQITPAHSAATSWGGENDTTAREKTITAVVTASFLLK